MKLESFAIAVLCTAFLCSCSATTVTVKTLPEDPISISVEQGKTSWIPGSAEQLAVHIGSISGGQTMLSIRDDDDHVVVDARSVRRGDVLAFTMGARRHYLQVMKLRKDLMTDHLAQLRFSTKKPGLLPPELLSTHVLPADPISISIEQRTKAWIPGSEQGLSVHIGDISRGQVMFSMLDSKNNSVVDARSVRRGDVVTFELGEKRHYLQVVELHNYLFDADLAEIRISSKKPDPLPSKKAATRAVKKGVKKK